MIGPGGYQMMADAMADAIAKAKCVICRAENHFTKDHPAPKARICDRCYERRCLDGPKCLVEHCPCECRHGR